LKRHFDECSACRLRLQEQERVISLIRSLPVQPLSEEVIHSIEGRTVSQIIDSAPESRRSRGRLIIPLWPKLAAGFAGAILAILIIWKALPESPRPEQPVYSETEARNAQLQAKWSLAYISDLMKKTEKRVVADLLLKDMPSTIKKSLEKSFPLLKGGQ
jgi:hypothetical protein